MVQMWWRLLTTNKAVGADRLEGIRNAAARPRSCAAGTESQACYCPENEVLVPGPSFACGAGFAFALCLLQVIIQISCQGQLQLQYFDNKFVHPTGTALNPVCCKQYVGQAEVNRLRSPARRETLQLHDACRWACST